MTINALAKALDRGFANVKLDPDHLARMTSKLFTQDMNEKLHIWYEKHMSYCYDRP
jgi:hypothetical protein